MTPSKQKNWTIAIVVYNGISAFHLSVPVTIFAEHRPFLAIEPMTVRLCSIEPSLTIKTSTGFTLLADNDLNYLNDADIIIVPSWLSNCEKPPEKLTGALQTAYQQNKLIVGLCLGTFVLASAGILEGKTVTTHWQWAGTFKKLYPSIKLNADVLYIDEGQIITSAGSAAAIDCCLYLLRRLYGSEIANRIAKQMVIAPHRQGGQAQFIEQPLPITTSNKRLSALVNWLLTHLDESHSIDHLAQKVAMSRRTFTRHFKQITGLSVTQWLLAQRFATAQHLLENTKLSIEQVSIKSGFNSSLALRQHFIKKLNLSPNQYRKNFQS